MSESTNYLKALKKIEDTNKIIKTEKKNYAPSTPIAIMHLPNHSGDHSQGNVRDTPTEDFDIVNKKYVDVFNSVPVNSSDKEYSLELQAKAYPLWISPLFAMWRRGHKDFFGFIDSKQENGRWSNSFLDKVLQELGY